MKKIVLLTVPLLLISLTGISQTQTSNNEKLNLQSPSSVSLFQSNSSNGVWATGTITDDRWGIFEDATSSKERLTVLPGGNVGIGTSNPTSRFHVAHTSGQGFAPVISGNVATFQSNNTPGYYASINLISGTDGRASFYFGDKDSGAMGGFRYNNTDNSLTFRTNGSDNRLFINSIGNVGIGTTNPSSMLHIKDPAGGAALKIERGGKSWNFSIQNIGDNLYLNNSDNPNTFFTFRKNGNLGIGTTSPSAKLEIKGAGDGVEILKLSTERPWVFKQEGTGASSNLVLQEISGNKFFKIKSYDNTDIYTIQSNSGNTYFKGNMGIGTNTPDAKLAVNGNIHAKEVKVDLVGWPDYVFENDYKLPTLQQVENHIAEKGHLENIPSAAEVLENGIQLGEMNSKLLQKIEELTLYMIEQNKKTENQQKEIYKLQEENKQLQSTNSILIELQMRLEKLESKTK
ncbi:tail fiber protein [uncultured Aquimarina sp.]|uniref:tail fiber protein n=1 Tax=uncultured Aquimarina sp. TaxID=575652 RepID=UPI00262BCB7F|nr:tail fiber protein [uncultured Aquimarina sp.]